MEDYNNWNRLSVILPPKGQRVLVSDGEVIVIAYYTNDDTHNHWLFDNGDMKDINIVWWKELDETPPKVEPSQPKNNT